MKSGPRVERTVGRVNGLMTRLRSRPGPIGRLLRRGLTVVTYTGRRSGRTFSTPVGFRRKGDEVTISVMLPDAKNWWRNFLGEGGPLSLELDDVQRTGHAVAQRDGKGRVTVRVLLDR
ncbi:nitroreductase/quinone reductase family protein [Actinocrispum sp. NPDC049592]|uniref:nitroreductase/quinone reductase family protein n=1 Tax=Actinocrispum sp. NPDC049592 TaxID=3154835 RepID=UPI0034396F62